MSDPSDRTGGSFLRTLSIKFILDDNLDVNLELTEPLHLVHADVT